MSIAYLPGELGDFMQSYLIVSNSLGVYLGQCLDSCLWSKGEHAGQDQAIAFTSKTDARAHALHSHDFPKDYSLTPVVADLDGFASLNACVKSGLDSWLPSPHPEYDAFEARCMIEGQLH